MIDPVDSMKRLTPRYRLMDEQVDTQMVRYRPQKTFHELVRFNRLIFYISKFKVLWESGHSTLVYPQMNPIIFGYR
jgi:hypothetical protein